MEEEEDLLKEFLIECAEGVGRLDQEFVALEKEAENPSLLASIFRTIHTIKGTCGFLGLPKLESIAHVAENVLSKMRDRKMTVTPERITVLLGAVDVIKEILAHLETAGSEPDKNYDVVRQSLDAVLTGETSAPAAPSKAPQQGAPPPAALQPVVHTTETHGDAKVEAERAEPTDQPAVVTSAKALTASESSIRVDVGLLDNLMNLVGELVLARNQLLQRIRDRDDADSGTAQRMNHITTELQDAVMKTRMQPIRNVWEKLPRVVRDLARSSGKDVELVMEGAETELDRTLLEAIKDPLTHIVRNAVDHGIETPDIRTAKGKPAKGTLVLKASHEGSQITIDIVDDGGGIDVERVKRKAVEKGLLTAGTATTLSEREALNLIFHAGLSTAEKITNVSGRGVGMDVVKTNIEKIGGGVEITSRLGQGTSLKIKIPLTLAIIPALMVTAGGDRFAIPQASLLELVMVDEEVGDRIEVIRGAEVYRLRGTLLPVLHLDRVLGIGPPPAEPVGERAGAREMNIVVLGAAGRSFGLVVNEVNDSEEIVVKPLNRQLKGLPMFAGATILGDGRVALILDVMGIAREGKLLHAAKDEAEVTGDEEAAGGAGSERQTLLTFAGYGRERFAVPLALVARLEEITADRVEQAAGREVIQYRGDLLPLIRLDHVCAATPPSEHPERLPAIVFSRGRKSVGLLVGRILDIVEATVALYAPPSGRAGVRGSLVIDGVTTDLLDIDHMIESAEPGWIDQAVAA